jgi:hypothetical protein
MCDDCNNAPEQSFNNWIKHHSVGTLEEPKVSSLEDLSIDAILTYRLKLFSADEIKQYFSLGELQAQEVSSYANHLIGLYESFLLSRMSES